MKKCDKIKDLFGAYLQDDVTPSERATVEEHISSCEKCAVDLKSRQRVLEMIKPAPPPDEIPQKIQDDFAWNVYRRIAADTMHQRTRRVFVRRFVLQPTFAAVAIVAVLAIGVTQFRPDSKLQKLTPVAANNRNIQKELRAKLKVKEFFQEQGMVFEDESDYAMSDETTVAHGSSSDVSHRAQTSLLPDSQRRWENANFIHYSLGDWKRALAEYRQLVDDFPDTDYAREAQVMISTISGMEYGNVVETVDEEQSISMGI